MSTMKEIIFKHKQLVDRMLRGAAKNLDSRGYNHDNTKLSCAELPHFEEAKPILESSEYLSKEYMEGLKILGPALEHHYANNNHHPEHYAKEWKCDGCRSTFSTEEKTNGVTCPVCGVDGKIKYVCEMSRMSLFDLLEMLIDWKAATEISPNGDIIKSIEKGQERFGYGDELKEILFNTLEEI